MLFVLLQEKPRDRGLDQKPEEVFDSILAHPFFWDAYRQTEFLVAVGNLDWDPSDIGDLPFIPDNWSDRFAQEHPTHWRASQDWLLSQKIEPAHHRPGRERRLGLLKFARNVILHQNPQKPIFLTTFPDLVVRLWMQLRPVLPQYPALRPFSRLFQPDFRYSLEPDWV